MNDLPPSRVPFSCFLSIAVRRAVRTAVLLTGDIRTPKQAEALLDEGAADLIGIGRALLRNTRWGLA